MKKLRLFISLILVLGISALFTACFDGGGGSVVGVDFIVDGEYYDYSPTFGNEIISLPTDPEIDGYSFGGWYYDENVWQKEFTADSLVNTPLNNSLRIYAWLIPIEYTITYHLDGGNKGNNPDTYTKSAGTINLADADKDGYEFKGWYEDSEFAIKITNIYSANAMNCDLYAKFSLSTYSITYHLNEGVNANNPKTYTLETQTIELKNPTKPNYTFTGWYLEEIFENRITEIETGSHGNLNLHARWAGTITFDSDGGNAVEPITQNSGTEITFPANPTKDAHRFLGWQLSGEGYTSTTMPDASITLKAVWRPFESGEGIQYAPYVISSVAGLRLLASLVNSGNSFEGEYFALGANIDLNNEAWTPIGNSETNYFEGKFDGKDHTVSNLSLVSSVAYGGLFGYSKNEIKNLGIVNISIESSNRYLGGLVGYNLGIITYCYTTGTIKSESNYDTASFAGGLAGYNGGVISLCYSASEIRSASAKFRSGGTFLGGLIGENAGTVSWCYTTGNTSISESGEAYVGGVVGYNNADGVLAVSYAEGDVEATIYNNSAYAGGVAGYSKGFLTDSYASGNIELNMPSTIYSSTILAYVGGLLGYNEDKIINCYSESSVLVDTYSTKSSVKITLYASGLVGYNKEGGTLDKCEFKGALNVKNSYDTNAGGIAGKNEGEISESKSSGSVDTDISNYEQYIGGFVGYNSGQIINCSVTGDVRLDSTNGLKYLSVGGLVGFATENSKITECKSENKTIALFIDATNSYCYAGGLIGRNMGELTDCSSTGEVNASLNVLDTHGGTEWDDYRVFAGGLIASNGGTVTDCYSEVKASASILSQNDGGEFYSFAGGLIASNGGTITNCYANGEVSATTVAEKIIYTVMSITYSYSGGLIASNSGTITDCYATGKVIIKSFVTIEELGFRSYAGGLIGYNNNDSEIIRCYATGAVGNPLHPESAVGKSNSNAGGLVGYNEGKITQCYAKGNVGEDGLTRHAGGLVGYNEGTIRDTFATGNVFSSPYSFSAYAGGLVGYNLNSIRYSFATGNVTSTSAPFNAYAGGLVGYNLYEIYKSFAMGNVTSNTTTGTAFAGGLFGYDTAITGQQQRFFIYSFDGQVITLNTASNTTAIPSNTLGIPVTAATLNTLEFYTTNPPAWGFQVWDIEIWSLDDLDVENGKYPTLKQLIGVER